MKPKDYTTTLLFDQSPKEVYKAINNVRGWWGAGIEGGTEKLHDEFIYIHHPFHYSKQKLVELIPDKKVVWLITDSSLSFTDDKSEWTGTKISFEIEKKGDQTQLKFTHHGLVPNIQCFNDCSNGWNYYLKESLYPLIAKGKGNPDKKEKSVKHSS